MESAAKQEQTNTEMVKVYAMNDCDWMAAHSLEEAKDEYMRHYAGDNSEEDALDDPHELNAATMEHLKYRDDDVQPSVVRTFAEQFQKLIDDGVEFPCFFASTEC